MDNLKEEKEFLIIFTDVHLAYSPSTLNLFHASQRHHSVELIAAKPAAYFSENQVIHKDIKYIDFGFKGNILKSIKSLFLKIADQLIKPSKKTLHERNLHNSKTKTIVSCIKKTKREIIVVDFLALWCVQQASKKAHFLSLEINENDPYRQSVQLSTIISVIIQSQERFDHLFPNEKPLRFLVQNAPVNLDFAPPYEQRKSTDLIYCGSAVPGFGIITCLDFIKDF